MCKFVVMVSAAATVFVVVFVVVVVVVVAAVVVSVHVVNLLGRRQTNYLFARTLIIIIIRTNFDGLIIAGFIIISVKSK